MTEREREREREKGRDRRGERDRQTQTEFSIQTIKRMKTPHKLLTLKESSKFSPPQIFKPSSYAPISKKYFLSMANKPPAWVGDL